MVQNILIKGGIMWDKSEQMDKEKMEKMTEKLKEMGIDEKMIDEKLLWTYKKVFYKLMKLRLVLDEKGLDEAKTKDILEKMVAKVMKKDLAKIKEWHSEHKDK
jgi:Asp-tRNA(Asn)/Glu-tRNA(Gln) amidotransferase B subunit